MKKYKPLLLKLDERRMPEYKAWLNPSSGKFIQFSTNGLHQEVSQENFGLDESQAIKRGYYRIFCGHELDIDSYSIPTEREFQTVKYTIDENSIKKFNGTRWNIVTQRGFIYFPKLSFLFANSITDGKKKVFEDIIYASGECLAQAASMKEESSAFRQG